MRFKTSFKVSCQKSEVQKYFKSKILSLLWEYNWYYTLAMGFKLLFHIQCNDKRIITKYITTKFQKIQLNRKLKLWLLKKVLIIILNFFPIIREAPFFVLFTIYHDRELSWKSAKKNNPGRKWYAVMTNFSIIRLPFTDGT